jgi:cold shock CspA family protein
MQPSSNERSYEMEGTVVFFDDARGYGWIRRDDGQMPDVYVHFTHIKGMPGHRQLFLGWRVRFELGDVGRGPMALNVHVTDLEREAV